MAHTMRLDKPVLDLNYQDTWSPRYPWSCGLHLLDDPTGMPQVWPVLANVNDNNPLVALLMVANAWGAIDTESNVWSGRRNTRGTYSMSVKLRTRIEDTHNTDVTLKPGTIQITVRSKQKRPTIKVLNQRGAVVAHARLPFASPQQMCRELLDIANANPVYWLEYANPQQYGGYCADDRHYTDFATTMSRIHDTERLIHYTTAPLVASWSDDEVQRHMGRIHDTMREIELELNECLQEAGCN